MLFVANVARHQINCIRRFVLHVRCPFVAEMVPDLDLNVCAMCINLHVWQRALLHGLDSPVGLSCLGVTFALTRMSLKQCVCETSMALNMRMNLHRSDWKTRKINRSPVAAHFNEESHAFENNLSCFVASKPTWTDG